ncbi:hypothetical protein EVAR_13320_1 [Eumeta japonica]|uniref:Uncharacterized protein n=1 Tax=Eumeta variegata TaxID=151549 RepID=A0A4C1TS83_EUMVA|nr:hypothetical protein EVAR_13320_1 [Eumeta japonica]
MLCLRQGWIQHWSQVVTHTRFSQDRPPRRARPPRPVAASLTYPIMAGRGLFGPSLFDSFAFLPGRLTHRMFASARHTPNV